MRVKLSKALAGLAAAGLLVVAGCSGDKADQLAEALGPVPASEPYADAPELRSHYLEGYRDGVRFAITHDGGKEDTLVLRESDPMKAYARGFDAGRDEVSAALEAADD